MDAAAMAAAKCARRSRVRLRTHGTRGRRCALAGDRIARMGIGHGAAAARVDAATRTGTSSRRRWTAVDRGASRADCDAVERCPLVDDPPDATGDRAGLRRAGAPRRPRRGPRLLGATAFVERAPELERRIRFMARRSSGRRGARPLAIGVGILSVTAAWVAPRPPVPISPVPPVTPATVVSVAQTPVTPPTIAPRLVADSSRQLVRPSVSSKPADVRRDTAVIAASVPAPADTTPKQRGVPTAPPFVRTGLMTDLAGTVDTIFHRLFDGIALTADQETKARDLLMNLAQEQAAQDQIVMQALTSSQPKRAAIQAQRDSALRALLTTDGDRAAFDARVAPPIGGGRSGGRGNDSLAGGRGGRGGGRGTPPGGGRGPGRGASPAAIADAMFHRLFDGLALTPAQEGDARGIIAQAQDDLQAFALPLLPLRLARRSGGGVVMQAQSDSAFAALLATDADRATLHARVIVVPLPPGRPQP